MRRFESEVLAGTRVVVCRSAEQAPSLMDSIEAAGGVPIALPLLVVADPSDGGAALQNALARLDTFDWLVVTSTNAVNAVAAITRSIPPGTKLASVGPATARACVSVGWTVNFQPSAATATALVAELPDVEGTVVLAPLAELAADTIEAGLNGRGAAVERVEAYRMNEPEYAPGDIDRALAADVALLTSPSIARRLAALAASRTFESVPSLPAAVVIGPSTEAAAIDAGFQVLAVADPHTEIGLVAALINSKRGH